MKRYIIASGGSSDSKLVSALIDIMYSTMGMGDSVSDLIEGIAYSDDIDAGEFYDPYEDYDADEVFRSMLSALVAKHSADIPDLIQYYFTEYDDTLLEEISTGSPSGKQSDLYKEIELIYDRMGEFPGGDVVKSAIEENIFNSNLIEDDAAELGYAIGHTYWQYIKSKEYGVRSNTASAVGVSIGCRDAIGGKYKYAFAQDISSYYYKDTYMSHKGMPSFTGYMLKFYKDGSALCADVFNLFCVSSKTVPNLAEWDIYDDVIYTFTFTDLDADGIDRASREIADWYDAHVQDAIDAAVNYRG